MRNGAPRVLTRCVANHYADKTRERIVEFEGGLISFRRQSDGTLLVNLYSLDANVRVGVDPAHLLNSDALAKSQPTG
jgi:hypothetical protein